MGRTTSQTTSRFTDLWPLLLVLALLLWPLDIALRRVSVGRRELADGARWVGDRVRGRRVARRTQQTDDLFAARGRAGSAGRPRGDHAPGIGRGNDAGVDTDVDRTACRHGLGLPSSAAASVATEAGGRPGTRGAAAPAGRLEGCRAAATRRTGVGRAPTGRARGRAGHARAAPRGEAPHPRVTGAVSPRQQVTDRRPG